MDEGVDVRGELSSACLVDNSSSHCELARNCGIGNGQSAALVSTRFLKKTQISHVNVPCIHRVDSHLQRNIELPNN